jgi:hypothetical protein
MRPFVLYKLRTMRSTYVDDGNDLGDDKRTSVSVAWFGGSGLMKSPSSTTC